MPRAATPRRFAGLAIQTPDPALARDCTCDAPRRCVIVGAIHELPLQYVLTRPRVVRAQTLSPPFAGFVIRTPLTLALSQREREWRTPAPTGLRPFSARV
ncbi:MAG: hypothetical protein Kow00123_23760 [Anaerolineales bacterium]